jgi:metal-responsive CopG/Arc/MetJ family transcriptional regulator
MSFDSQQLNVEIDPKLLDALEDLKKRTRVPKRALVEQALRMLVEQYHSMAAVYKNWSVYNH